MKRIVFFLLAISIGFLAEGQLSKSFELRYYSENKENITVSDFKGGNSVFSTEERIAFLKAYARVAGEWFADTALNTKINTDAEISSFLDKLKGQPLPDTRRRLMLEDWKSTGIHPDDPDISMAKFEKWKALEGIKLDEKELHILTPGFNYELKIDTLQWRFFLSWKAFSGKGRTPLSIAIKENSRIIAETGFHSNGNIFFTDNGFDRMAGTYIPGRWYTFKLEVDLVNQRYNLYVNNEKAGDWSKLKSCASINRLQIKSGQDIRIDSLLGLKFDTTACTVNHPYTMEAFLEEHFEVLPSSMGWQLPGFDDRSWNTVKLPAVRGGALEAGEDLFLRKKIRPGSFKQAWLNIESLDPGGEIWINGRIIHVTHKRHPVKLNISDFLLPYQENTIAIRVFPFYNEGPLYHSPQDRNVGWFCGRAWIDLSSDVRIENAKVYTLSPGPEAEQIHKLEIHNDRDETFRGTLRLSYTPWFPNEGRKVYSTTIPVKVYARDSIHLQIKANIENPHLWTHENPFLYKVQFELSQNGEKQDDEVITTGIRSISQEGGTLRINRDPELLGGAQTMGFRMPLEKLAKWNRCPPAEVLADELLACKKLGNTLRIHVHAGGKYAYSINDPRIAEMADQLGLMLIWPTASWIREGEWGGIDFEGYPLYMEQVFNHPSIIIWEGANHPNRFNDKDLEYSNRFIQKIYRSIYSTDSSRLIAPTSYNRHFIYGNDEGTVDKEGNPITACAEWTAPMMVRGNQDALTGYGASWEKIRNFPDPYRASFLDSKERAYINFEHEESIGMQNFSLARGKPWYQLPSYENRYDLGSIGRELEYDEWKESQAWQAFSAWESMKWQRIKDVDGFSWCSLHGGPNSGTYRKPLIDALGHAKLAYYTNQMALQDIIAGSNNTDVYFSKKEKLTPVILNLGEALTVRLKIIVRNMEGESVDSKEYQNVQLRKGRTINEIPSFRPKLPEEGYYIFEYYVLRN